MEHEGASVAASRRAYSVRLTMPAASELVKPVRLAVGGLASIGDFSVESVEELQLAANELLVVLMNAAGDAELALELRLDEEGAFRMEASAENPSGEVDPELVAVSERILSVMADEHRLELDDGVVSGGFVRHRDTWTDEDLDVAAFD